jgi:hypothetical protein
MLLVALMVRSLDETMRRTENGMALLRIDLDQKDVIRDRVEPAASAALSAIPRERK